MFWRKRKNGLDDFQGNVVKNVEEHGCFIHAVPPLEEGFPTYAYSIGFTKTAERTKTAELPEVLLFGLPDEVYGPAINYLLQIGVGGCSFSEGERVSGVFGDYDAIVRVVDESWLTEDLFGSMLWYHSSQMGGAKPKVAMLVWPDTELLYPWDDGCADWVRASQPAIYEPRPNL
jgi:hypothetical protein